MTNKQKTHLNELFEVMLSKGNIKINGKGKGKGKEKNLIIQRINLDGECDIYSQDTEEMEFYDIPAEQIKIV
jgi:hypothetical protein